MLAVQVKHVRDSMNGKLQFLGSSTQSLNFSSFACRLKKNETDKLYNLKKLLCFALFQEHGSFLRF